MKIPLPSGRSLRTNGRFAEGVLRLEAALPATGTSDGLALVVEHPFRAPRHVFVPHLAPTDAHVMADFVFRAPAVVLADEQDALALVPDLDDVAAADGFRTWLDADLPRGRVVLAAGAWAPEGHVFFERRPVAGRGQRVRLRLHVLASDRPRDLEDPFGMAARFLWRRWGRGRDAARWTAPPSRHAARIARWAFSSEGWGDEVWQTFALEGRPVGAPVFIVDVTRHPSVPPAERRWREPRSVWNQAWFSTQRCANGLLRHARQVGSEALAERARLMTEVALGAPQEGGLFPSVLRCEGEGGWETARWTGSDRRPPSASERACHLVDAAFTCQNLLEWDALCPDARVRPRVERFAARLEALQLPSGAFPGWVEPDGSSPADLRESAESAVSVTLLLALGRLEAAQRGLRFLEGVIGDARWEDFETYWSCAPWGTPGQRVLRNGVYKQNTLALFWCAEATFAAWRRTRERRWLRLARRCLDELSLHQAVWDPPFLPAPAHGGFGVMNGDSEWNDARQSLFAPLYAEVYRATGELELWERAASALRASFSMLYCPENEALARAYERRFPFFGEESHGFMMENQGHGAADPVGTFTIYTWGNGSALASAAKVRDGFGDVFVTPRRAVAWGGFAARLRGDRVELEDRFDRPEALVRYEDGRSRRVKLRAGKGSAAR